MNVIKINDDEYLTLSDAENYLDESGAVFQLESCFYRYKGFATQQSYLDEPIITYPCGNDGDPDAAVMIDTTAPEKVYVDGLVDIGIQSLVQAAHDGGDCFISQFECLTGLVNGEQTKVSLFWNDKFICIPQQPLNLYDGSNYNDDILVKVSDLDALAEKYGIPLKEHEPIKTDVSVVVTHTQNIETVNHTSELLEIMNRCIAENWENHNPINPPTNDRLEAWFEENYQGNKLLSGKIKTAMLAIMRPSEYK